MTILALLTIKKKCKTNEMCFLRLMAGYKYDGKQNNEAQKALEIFVV